MIDETRDFGMIRCTVQPGELVVTLQVIETRKPIGMPLHRARLWGCEEVEAALGAARSLHAAARSAVSGDQLRALTWAAGQIGAADEARQLAVAAAVLDDCAVMRRVKP